MKIIKSISNVISKDKSGFSLSENVSVYFPDCAVNFNAEHHDSSKNCIGIRDISANPPYYEFFTGENHIKILFDIKGIFHKSKNRKLFNDMRKY
ncbi:MAG: hypothetical protein K2G36_10805, partial [Ruminococcus sp.]|nr:hypothetical protein [Ruminococcus sp.]